MSSIWQRQKDEIYNNSKITLPKTNVENFTSEVILKDGEKCACTLQDELTIVQSTLSHHMKILIESKVVEARKDKKWTYYSLSDSGSELAKNTLSEILTKSENYSSFCICED